MFKPGTGSLGGGGIMLQLSAKHKTHPNRLLSSFDSSIPWNNSDRCGVSVYSASCEYASSYWSDGEILSKCAALVCQLIHRLVVYNVASILADLGKSWHISNSRVLSMDESEVLELADGRIAMFSRNQLNPNPKCVGVNMSRCATHQDGPCMCVGRTLSTDGGTTWQTSEFLPTLFGANCHGSALTFNGSACYAMPAYTGPARLPNPVQPSCTFKGRCYTDRAPNRINGTIFKAMDAELRVWQVLQRVTIGAADGGHQTYAAFGYSSLSPLPPKIWPHSVGLIYETGAPDCGYDPHQPTATGTGSSTSACKIAFSVVDLNNGQNTLKIDDEDEEHGYSELRSARSHNSSLLQILRGERIKQKAVKAVKITTPMLYLSLTREWSIIYPAVPNCFEIKAAEVLRAEIFAATNLTLTLLSEAENLSNTSHGIYVGRTEKIAATQHLAQNPLAAEEARFFVSGGDLFIVGDDTRAPLRGNSSQARERCVSHLGDLPACVGVMPTYSTCRAGTLYAAYSFSREVLGVRYVWPGEDGAVRISGQSVAMAANLSFRSVPAIPLRQIRPNPLEQIPLKELTDNVPDIVDAEIIEQSEILHARYIRP
eukprot:SAG31_NODE_1072_length_10065_cov_2.900662_7_plen_598_part_00